MNKNENKVAFIYIGQLSFSSRLLKQITTLKKNKFSVTMLLGNENHEEKGIRAFDFEVVNRVVKHSRFKLLTFLNLLRFCYFSSKKVIEGEFNSVVCCGLNTLLAGVLAKSKIRFIKLIYDSNELYVERESGLRKMVWDKVQRFFLRYCDVIIHAEANRLNYFMNLYSLSEEKLTLIENYPCKREYIRCNSPNDEIKVIYLGAVNEGRYIQELVDVFIQLDGNIRFDIVGFGEEKFIEELKKIVEINDKRNIKISPPVPNHQIPELLKKYNIGIALYRNTNLNNYYCAPNKVYQYINCGLPVISNNYPGLRNILEKNKIGFCIDNVDADNINNAINTIVENKYYNNITSKIRSRYVWENQESRYLQVFTNGIRT